MVQWERVQSRVAIAGRVTNKQTGKAIAGVQVTITEAPEAFTTWLQFKSLEQGNRWNFTAEPPDRTRTAVDGHFHFLDLPEGEYSLTAALPDAGKRYANAQITVTVPCQAEDKTSITIADMMLPPTTLKGKISDQNADPVVLATVQIKHGTDSTFSNQEGQYLLLGLEASETYEQTVMVSAQGYQPTSRKVVFSQPGIEKTLNFVLQK